jgi:hypothetical protein
MKFFAHTKKWSFLPHAYKTARYRLVITKEMLSQIHMNSILCCGIQYQSLHVQTQISRITEKQSHQWIYCLECQPNEQIFLNNKNWLLATDKHPGVDSRYLIIYKNLSLKTIRDLRYEHIPMLLDSYRSSISYLKTHEIASPQKFYVFFHYIPSVFQLHAHITLIKSTRNQDRVHEMKHIIRNLQRNTFWYRDAIILTRMSKLLILTADAYNIAVQKKWRHIYKNLLRIKPKQYYRIQR